MPVIHSLHTNALQIDKKQYIFYVKSFFVLGSRTYSVSAFTVCWCLEWHGDISSCSRVTRRLRRCHSTSHSQLIDSCDISWFGAIGSQCNVKADLSMCISPSKCFNMCRDALCQLSTLYLSFLFYNRSTLACIALKWRLTAPSIPFNKCSDVITSS